VAALPCSKNLRLLFWVVGVTFSLITLIKFGDSLDQEIVHRKDLFQDYLLVNALKAELNPYLPVSSLCTELGQKGCSEVFKHPSPHPPANLSLFYGLSGLTYGNFALAWGLISILALALSALVISRIIEAPLNPILIFLLLLGSEPARSEIISGQLNCLSLLIWSLALFFLSKKKIFFSGAVIGSAVAVKMSGYLVPAYLFLKKKYFLALSALASAVILSLLFTFISPSITSASDYIKDFLSGGKEVSGIYQSAAYNFSITSYPSRLCSGTNEKTISGPIIKPLISDCSWLLNENIGIILSLGLATACMLIALKFPLSNKIALGLLSIGVVTLPVTWGHSLILLGLPLWVIQGGLKTSPDKLLLLVLFTFWFFGDLSYSRYLISGNTYSFAYGLGGFLPGLMALCLFYLSIKATDTSSS